MDQERYQQLTMKRDDIGLTDEEADELGKMMADAEGQEYSNAEIVRDEDRDEDSSSGSSLALSPCAHLGCGCSVEDIYCSDFCREHAEEPSDHGPEFDCGCGHDECKAVVGEA